MSCYLESFWDSSPAIITSTERIALLRSHKIPPYVIKAMNTKNNSRGIITREECNSGWGKNEKVESKERMKSFKETMAKYYATNEGRNRDLDQTIVRVLARNTSDGD